GPEKYTRSERKSGKHNPSTRRTKRLQHRVQVIRFRVFLQVLFYGVDDINGVVHPETYAQRDYRQSADTHADALPCQEGEGDHVGNPHRDNVEDAADR